MPNRLGPYRPIIINNRRNKRASLRSRQLSFRRGSGVPWIALGIAAILAIIVLFAIIIPYSTKHDVTFTVQDKIVKYDHSDKSDVYMIYTDKGTYQDKDAFVFFKFNSSDVYGQLKRNHTYTCSVTGFRIPIFSSYRNILNCHEVAR